MAARRRQRRRWSTATPTARAASCWRRASTRQVLSDWDFDGAPPRAEVLRLTRDGFARIDLRCRDRDARLVAALRQRASSARSSAAPFPTTLWQLTLARYPFLAARAPAAI